VRMFRILRVYRLVRTLRTFQSLRVLVATICASCLALFWSMVLFWVVMIIGALSMCQMLMTVYMDQSISEDVRMWAYKMYGTPTRAMYTFFEMTFSGCWPNFARILVEEVGSAYAFFFIFYIGVVSFAMMRIVAALFLKETMRVAEHSERQMVIQNIDKIYYCCQELAEMFKKKVGFRHLTFKELVRHLREPDMAHLVAEIDIADHELLFLFYMLDESEGKMDAVVSAEGFLNAAFLLKGLHCNHDVISVMQRSGKILRILKELDQHRPLLLSGGPACDPLSNASLDACDTVSGDIVEASV